MDVAIPQLLVDAFDGRALDAKLGLSALLTTVDADGWPHASFLGAGDMLLDASGQVGLILWPQATTVANLDRTRQGILFAAANGAVSELRFAVATIDKADGRSTIIVGRVIAVRTHRAPYADVDAMIGFRLHDPEEVVPRWQSQIVLLRAALPGDDT